jgi:hypothetical protein
MVFNLEPRRMPVMSILRPMPLASSSILVPLKTATQMAALHSTSVSFGGSGGMIEGGETDLESALSEGQVPVLVDFFAE